MFKATGRHARLPRESRGIARRIATAAAAASVLAAMSFAGAALSTITPPPAHAAAFGSELAIATSAYVVTVTPEAEYAACVAVYHYHHESVTDYGGIHDVATFYAWVHSWHEALYAGPEMRRDIHRYLDTGNGWSWVALDCNPHVRPVWDGTGTYSSGVQPLCPARDAGHTAVAGIAPYQFRVTCNRDGAAYVWDAAR